MFPVFFAIAGLALIIYRNKIASRTIKEVERYWAPKTRFLFKKEFRFPAWFPHLYAWAALILGILFIFGSFIAIRGPIRI